MYHMNIMCVLLLLCVCSLMPGVCCVCWYGTRRYQAPTFLSVRAAWLFAVCYGLSVSAVCCCPVPHEALIMFLRLSEVPGMRVHKPSP